MHIKNNNIHPELIKLFFLIERHCIISILMCVHILQLTAVGVYIQSFIYQATQH